MIAIKKHRTCFIKISLKELYNLEHTALHPEVIFHGQKGLPPMEQTFSASPHHSATY